MSRIFISAAQKSSGKTTVSIGICAALKQQGLVVQGFKKGPDYIDPYWLYQATQRDCYNLDFYTMTQKEMLSLLAQKSQDADFNLIEGNKGLYDGLDLDGSNSNAALATLTETPVILVLNARGMTRGIAPLILGYQAFDEKVNIKGVILNQLGGSRHESKLRNVIEHYTDVTVIGAIHNDTRFDIDERHLGLIPGHEDPFCQQKISLLAQVIKESVNLSALRDIAKQAPALSKLSVKTTSATSTTAKTSPLTNQQIPIKLGVLRGMAFGFYYPDDLQALQQAGAQLIDIDPIKDFKLPEIDALFIGGGFPEMHLNELEANKTMRQSINRAIENNLPCYAECGGLMYLAKSIQWSHDTKNPPENIQINKAYTMVGSIDSDIIVEPKPQGRGYVRLAETGHSPWQDKSSITINAHEFHYSRFKNVDKKLNFAYKVKRGMGINGKFDGYYYKNLLANYTHQRHTLNNPWTTRFLNFARAVKLDKQKGQT